MSYFTLIFRINIPITVTEGYFCRVLSTTNSKSVCMCSKLPSSLKTLIACCAAFDIGLLIEVLLFPNPIFAGVIAIFPSTGVM
jgi:hypothetical protein